VLNNNKNYWQTQREYLIRGRKRRRRSRERGRKQEVIDKNKLEGILHVERE